MIPIPPQVFAGDRPERKRVVPVSSSGQSHNKPLGGLWTSDLIATHDGPTSPWIEWARWNGPVGDRWLLCPWWLLLPRKGRYLIVDSRQKALALPSIEFRPVGYPAFSEGPIDWERLASQWDAVRFTDLHSHVLLGIDVPSTIWFRWKFDEPIRLKE